MTTLTVENTSTAVAPVVVVPAAVLRELVSVTVAAGKDDSPPTLTGVRIEWEPGLIRMVATDRFRLAVTEWRDESVADAVAGSALVPAKELAAYVKGLPKPSRGFPDFPVTLTLDVIENGHSRGHAVTFTCTTYDGQQVRRVVGLDGEFPKWAPLFPDEGTLAASEGVCMVAYNPHYLADLAKMPQDRKGDPVRMSFTTPNRPAVCQGKGSHVEWKYLLMPVRTGGGA
jgi:DNA polymerase III sliding clamp (beta) subunit (PCNA family)